MEAFMEDYMRFTYIIKALTMYKRGNTVDMRKLLNHVIIVYNVFDYTATEILFDKAAEDMYGHVAAILTFLSRMPTDTFTSLNGKTINPLTIEIYQPLLDDLEQETGRNG